MNLKASLPLLLILSAVGVVTFGGALLTDGYGLSKHIEIETPALVSTHEDYRSMEALQGKTVFLTFGFTNCVEICPMTLASLKKLSKQLDEQTEFVFVSVDNQRDDLQTLNTYLNLFGDKIIGWRMAHQDLSFFASQFGAQVSGEYDLEPGHSAGIHMIDEEGKLVRSYPYKHLDVAEIVQDYATLKEVPSS